MASKLGVIVRFFIDGCGFDGNCRQDKRKINQIIERVTCFLLGFNYQDYTKLMKDLKE